jgi:hypothetical protein
MSFEQSISEGGLVINTSGGKYSGGFDVKEDLLCYVPGSTKVSQFLGTAQWIGGLVIVLIFFVIVFFMWGTISSIVLGEKFHSGFSGRGLQIANSGPHMRFTGSNSQVGLGVHNGFSQEDRAAEYAESIQSGFNNSRDEPHFQEANNNVLRMENREKEAVRALGKINQERLRRAAEDTSSTTPLPWGPFWKEWKQTHVMDGEDIASGFENDFTHQLNHSSVY